MDSLDKKQLNELIDKVIEFDIMTQRELERLKDELHKTKAKLIALCVTYFVSVFIIFAILQGRGGH